MSGDRRFAGPRTGRCPRYTPSPSSPSIRYMLRKGMEWDAKRRRKTCGEIGLAFTCCSQQVRYKCQVPRGPWVPGYEIYPNYNTKPQKCRHPKMLSIAILLAVVARIRAKLIDVFCCSRHHLVKVNLQLVVGSRRASSNTVDTLLLASGGSRPG